MRLTVQIELDLDNAAFEDDGEELTRLLAIVSGQAREVFQHIAADEGPPLRESRGALLRDINGNTVGTYDVLLRWGNI